MEYFKTLNLSTLIAILSDFTVHCAEKQTTQPENKEDIELCKETIEALQREIAYRKQVNR